MTQWTSGYGGEIGHPHTYYRETSPTLLSLALLNRNVSTSHPRAPRYLELGFRQGLSLNIHAAACPGEFWGTDFNPVHATTAQEMAEISGAGPRIFDLSFAELAAREDLPEFDMIVLHGVWSWISDEDRGVIVDLVRRKLAAGGIFYLSYNCTPGWSPVMPLRDLMRLHAELAGSQDEGISRKVSAAIEFTQRVVDSGGVYFRVNPGVAEWLKSIQQHNRNCLAHEYFNRDWQPMPFSQVAEWLSEAKLSFCASADLLTHVDQFHLTPEWQALLGSIGHAILRESVRDYLVAQQFRKDIFVKGGRTMVPLEQFERFGAQGFVLAKPPPQGALQLNSARGSVVLPEAVCGSVMAALSGNGHAPKTVAELIVHPACRGLPAAHLIQMLLILTGAGHELPAQRPEAIKAARPRCEALNAYLCQRARHAGDVAFLASPVTGMGIPVPRIGQLFLLARRQGRSEPQAWPAFVWEILGAQGQRLVKDGKTLESAEDNLAELTARARAFADQQLPILKAMGVAA
jgi:SAM-dependent methyltransferase